jgi:hypothetical protein
MGCCGGFVGKLVDTAVSIVTDPVQNVKDMAKTIDDIVIQPAIDIVEGSIDLSKNSLETAGKVTESVVKGDLSDAEDELKSGVNNIDAILSETYMDVRDPLEAAAVIAGNYFLPGSSLVTKELVSEGAQDILNTSGGQKLTLAAGATGGAQGNTSNYGEIGKAVGVTPDPNAVGGVTGPDNIDVGGGWSPADGATAAELEAARVALEQPPVETVPVETPPPTVEQITSDIAADNIDAGGGWSPATGATEAELAQAKAAMASNGWTLKQALDAVRAGLLVNSITGDPLGLGDSGGGGGATGPTGFAQVPIPTEWKSPEYSYTPVQNVTFEDLFPGVSLQGTQWQGLQNVQPNMSFNDIFASGMQQTPMGSPVDINQIVSAIVGQNAKI